MQAESIKIVFQPVGTRVDVNVGSTVLEAGREAGLILAANCGGNGICGRCRVTVLGENIPAPTEVECRVLNQEEIEAGQRLACRARLSGDAGVHIPRTTLGNQQRLQLDGDAKRIRVDACVRRHNIEAFAPSLEDSASDFERVVQILNSELGGKTKWHAGTGVIRRLSRLARESGWRFTVLTRGDEIIGITGAGNRPLGVAVDLGCTKIAAYLLDLETGDQLAACGIPNPQISYGEDLISRLVLARGGQEKAQELAHCVQRGISGLIDSLVEQSNVNLDQVADLCVVGNTAMMHLLLELPVDGLLAAPFVAATTSAVDTRAKDIGIELPNEVYLHVLPGIGAFVGADHVAMILANGLHSCSYVALGIDIGTNTEIALSRPDHGLLLTASCPSGPAFEGGHIRHGMRAAPGAIEKIRLTADGPSLKTIDHLPPVGLCGSGVIDAIAQLWRTGAIDYRGHLQAGEPRVRQGKEGKEYVLVEAKDTGHGKDIVITQQDISEVQLAKAAVAASIKTLLTLSNTQHHEIEEMVLAGAFGSYLDVDSSVAIGLLPKLPKATCLQAGNSAGTGAKMALVSAAMRDQAGQIAQRAVRIELKQQKGFNRELALATRFPRDQFEKEKSA
jgi:uncharacterized 2Fe-2S/4Fe-4S cluster protein (DUF4445 family)